MLYNLFNFILQNDGKMMDGSILTLKMKSGISDEDFYDLSQANEAIRLERDQNGNLVIISPTGFNTGRFNNLLAVRLTLWNEEKGAGVVGDSSTGYKLPNGAIRSPDLSWVSKVRLEPFSEQELEKIAPLCPDFVVELRSPSDNLSPLKEKMEEYIDNGCRLGWLIDREQEWVFIYRSDGSIQINKSFDLLLDGEEVLPGFELRLEDLLGD
jgi:Uma2 family endonuclease